jgi:two-component system KDP operon response regulator KdpE
MSSKKILIIDDDQHLQLGLATRLKANGYKISFANDAISAIAAALKEIPDLVILDLGLPAGDGFLVLQRMRSLRDLVTTPVIVLSARDPAENEKRALDAGAVAFFQKPPAIHEFLTAIRQALGETTGLSTFLKT